MKRWIVKSAVQRAISWLPRSHWWNGLLQKHVTKGLELTPASFEAKLQCCRTHFEYYQTYGPKDRSDFTALEIGTGWFPIVPVGFYLCGAATIRTFDVAPLVSRYTLRQTARRFCEYEEDGTLQRVLPGLRAERMAQLRRVIAQADHESPAALLKTLNIQTVVGDARRTGLPAESTDLVFSTVTLEHIPREVLAGLFAEFRRISSKGALMSHYIGMADQFASFDHSITPYNFMKYPAKRWRLLDNPIIPQNRLRVSDYRKLIEAARFRIVEQRDRSGDLEDLRRVELAPHFRKYSTEDLLVLFSWFVAQPGHDPGVGQTVPGGVSAAHLRI